MARRSAERERDAAEASRDRFSFLAEASRCLADSLDYEKTLATVAGMALPYLDAWCIVDVLTDEGVIRRLAVLHPDADKQAAARELHGHYPPHADDLIGAARVIRTGRPEMVFDVPDEALVAAARGQEHLALLRTLGVKSYVVAPMVARGRVLGAITFVTADTTRRFGDIDVVMAEDLARRAAMAVDNAHLHQQAVEAQARAEDAFQEAEAATEALRDARDTAESALKARSDFLATMTHEVRTPLNAIIGYMQLLELDVAGELTEQQRSYVERARESTRHLVRLVEDVLDLAKTEAGRLSVARDVVLAVDTARAAVALLAPQAAGKLVSLADVSADGGGVHYVGDEHRVRQVLINLLANAIKFTPAGGHVTLECAREGEWAVFRVRDTGRGVTPEDAAVIFEPFVQGEAGLRRTHGGAGLGLSISRGLARLMGGDVTFEPPIGGATSGATFTLRVPAAPPTDGDRPPAEPRRPADADRAARGANTAVGVPHRTPAQRAAARRGLGAASEALLAELGPTIHEFVHRARADEALAVGEEMTDVEVADHLATLLTDLANSLAVLGEASGEPTEQLADGSKIQRLIGELHGAQRHRLGWTEAQLVREGEIVRKVCAAAVGRAAAADERAAEDAGTALSRLLQERMRACLRGYRAAASAAS
ncbi:MAG TPA: GAF domain-containing sensor histidine kinase [Gemmatimonadaceae bacterium]|nr:GAF domain-containing sensor histidine kinase [Gemmatimonadaceae bacterium]